MADFNPSEPLGERMARAETLLTSIQEDVTEIRSQMDAMTLHRTTQDAYARVGKLVWGIVERVLLTVGGAGAMMWLQRHFPSGHN